MSGLMMLKKYFQAVVRVSINKYSSVAPALKDNYGRDHTYLRVSLSERCNLRCTYCMPEEGVPLTHKNDLLQANEIIKLVKLFVENGVNKVRFTGGEPLVRKDCVEIVREVGRIKSLKKIGITTNGIVLEKKLNDLKSAGLTHLNVSLDTLQKKKFQFIAKRDGFEHVMKSIDASLNMGFSPLKLNCVVMRGLNDDEICDFIELTKNKNLDIRFIEYMPFDGNKWNSKKMISFREILKIIAEKYSIEDIMRLTDEPNDTSKAFKIRGYTGRFGFITSMSEHFCGSCNRLRLTADGNLKVCLFGNAEVSLRDALRANATDQELNDLIGMAVRQKKEKHAGMEILSELKNRPMILIGGLPNVKKSIHEEQQELNKSSETEHVSKKFSHFDNTTQNPKQVDISDKPANKKPRIALASGYIQLNQTTLNALAHNKLKKGNALVVAEIAGIQASKQTANLIPLCHQILLDVCDIKFEIDNELFRVRCEVTCKTSLSKTGVEMEALTACSVALLTLYDMCKAVQKDACIKDIRLESKEGGKSDYKRI